mmetsp:Transcript_51648/g.90778  ORF Transcript_51648/g.90778 Transcript_51648/m.90778 type:complete len:210 (+) Transcript_51648:372-1001(+)
MNSIQHGHQSVSNFMLSLPSLGIGLLVVEYKSSSSENHREYDVQHGVQAVHQMIRDCICSVIMVVNPLVRMVECVCHIAEQGNDVQLQKCGLTDRFGYRNCLTQDSSSKMADKTSLAWIICVPLVNLRQHVPTGDCSHTFVFFLGCFFVILSLHLEVQAFVQCHDVVQRLHVLSGQVFQTLRTFERTLCYGSQSQHLRIDRLCLQHQKA